MSVTPTYYLNRAQMVNVLAGLISTFPPHDKEHPEACLPIARALMDAFTISDPKGPEGQEAPSVTRGHGW